MLRRTKDGQDRNLKVLALSAQQLFLDRRKAGAFSRFPGPIICLAHHQRETGEELQRILFFIIFFLIIYLTPPSKESHSPESRLSFPLLRIFFPLSRLSTQRFPNIGLSFARPRGQSLGDLRQSNRLDDTTRPRESRIAETFPTVARDDDW
ncbi:uncharacterized protein BJX67DRAFT_28702 [Aspergillus lucknowensis]|uniref:Uncharacterized protein n=1 Tax=Aspergillus lucknowensis TaxID=176173 RepID=A0ABR4L5M0_9EURO